MGALAVGVQVGIQIKEVVDLVKSWEATHPSANAITSMLSTIDADCSRYNQLLKDVDALVCAVDCYRPKSNYFLYAKSFISIIKRKLCILYFFLPCSI